MIKRIPALLSSLFICASLNVMALPEIKGNPAELEKFLKPEVPTVILKAKAEEKAYTDTAIISLVVTTENKLMAEAIKQNTNLRTGIMSTLVQAGIKADKIQSSKFSSSPQFGWFGSKPSSYEVVNRLAITIDDGKFMTDIANIADSHSEVELVDTQFEHSKAEAYTEKAKQKALEKILKEKSIYEKSLGVTLIAVDIIDTNVNQHGTDGAYALEEIVVTGARMSKSRSTSSNYSAPAVRTFDEINYKAEVGVLFKVISDK